jgi:hypothetical protein
MTSTNHGSDESSATPASTLRVVRGTPTDAELAALVAVLAARIAPPSAPADDASGAAPRSTWADRRRLLLAAPHMAGPDAWRRSTLPRG